MSSLFRSATAAAALVVLAGCASLPGERGYADTSALIAMRRGVAPRWMPTAFDTAPELPTRPITVEESVRLAFFNNPRIREEYARLGLGRAELDDARRIANPSFGYARLDARDADGSQITRSVSLSITDLLLLSARKRFASGELDRLQKSVAGALLALATEVEIAWYRTVGAQQIAAMRALVAQAASHSAELAQRFFDAGNINRLQLEQEYAAASSARIAALRAGADALRARTELAGLIGLPAFADWATATQLAAPPESTLTADGLLPLALDQRLDLAAARQSVVLREDALGITRRWRWLGTVEVGYERESEVDGELLRGPSLALALPIFNQGQGALARADAELLKARAELDALALGVRNTAHLGIERLRVTRDISERYRIELVPRREAIVARTQEQVNFMFVGVFELLLAKQQEYDAYQEYLEAVRDYWIARSELRGAVGGRLPDDGQALEPTLGVEAVLPSAVAPAMDHSMHGGADAASGSAVADPHAGHRMTAPEPKAQPAPDPHAGHAMPTPAIVPAPIPLDPHAGHAMPSDAGVAPTESDDNPSTDDTHDKHGDTP